MCVDMGNRSFLWEPLVIHFDCERLHSSLAALSGNNESSTMNSIASGPFFLPPGQQGIRSFSSYKQFLEAPLVHARQHLRQGNFHTSHAGIGSTVIDA